ncbi:MAG TPA: hypothetical protein VLO10_07440 [Candidatus Deferrimicrobium sp.]|nr:hypothetical protein [Candidatus Deferrimicrobium sp.]
MIATNDAVDVLRHGWQDAATTLAADVPEVAELLEARLELAIATERLDEIHLLDTIQEMESVTSRAGSPSGQALARRLRRTVYEYLLALDAARPLEITRAPVDQPATAQGSPMVGAEEVAALGHASRGMPGAVADVASLDTAADHAAGEAVEPASADRPASRRRFALRRRSRPEAGPAEARDTATESPGNGGDGAAHSLSTMSAAVDASEPDWQFTPAPEPPVFDAGLAVDPADDEDADGAEPPGAAGHSGGPQGSEPELESDSEAWSEPESAPAPEPEPETETAADVPAIDPAAGAAGPSPTFVAPRVGFHIVEDAPTHRADQEQTRLEMPTFSADEVSDAPAQAGAAEAPPTAADAPEATAGNPSGSEFLAWQPPIAPQATPVHGTAPPQVAPAAAELSAAAEQGPPAPPHPAPEVAPSGAAAAAQRPHADPEPAQVAPVQEPEDDPGDESRGWGVRKHGEGHPTRRGVPALVVRPIEDDPFESHTRLSDMRRRIEERLRRKRCDEAAALLQEIAQETGGRAVAELAMNAGDRCRALGKSNAALNCYLAAARSDPVYELPLSRLADICIDNQDTDLAVSYLERIARIYRFREEDRAALRTYRRIATIAPYREDVLTLLMNAQRTGQLE